jgi:hypothetical protein
LLKEVTKRVFARAGSTKYAMHGPNETIRPSALRDGSPVYEFIRCNPHWGGVCSCEQGRHIGEVVTDRMLKCLIRRGGTCILYTHLGKIDDVRAPFNKAAVVAFRRLSEASQHGGILVTTTRRLLGYRLAMREITFQTTCDKQGLRIDLSTWANGNSRGKLCRADLGGLTFYVPDPQVAHLTIDGQDVLSLQRNEPDHTGRPSVSVPWNRLQFPDI